MPVLAGRTLSELKEGDQADLFVLVEERTSPLARPGEEACFVLEVSDRSGQGMVRIGHGERAFEPCRAVKRGDVVKLRVMVEKAGAAVELRGLVLRSVEDQDGVDVESVGGAVFPAALAVASGVVAFDIETTPRLAPRDLPERELRKLLRWAVEDARRETGLEPPRDEDVEESLRKALALNPLTTRVVSIAFSALETGAELALIDAPQGTEPLAAPSRALPERSILETFWAIARRARTLVGFNSRRFDVPVLLTRSALLGVRATVNLLAGRSESGARHVDLSEILSARGASSDRRLSLELASFAFGIPAKTETHGSEVALLVEEERYQELAEYNLEDARATADLYRRLVGTWL